MLPMEHFRYSSDLPYPDIRVEMKNPAYARAILDNVGGVNSEMSAVSLYVYNSLIIESDPEIAAVFHNVGMVEMRHLELFGKLAQRLGEDPRMWTHCGSQKTYWSPDCNQYPQSLTSLIPNVIDCEKAAISKYQHQITYIRDENVTDLLRRIILDERLHVEIFQHIYRTYCGYIP